MRVQENPQLILVADHDMLLKLVKKSMPQGFDKDGSDFRGSMVATLPFPHRLITRQALKNRNRSGIQVESQTSKKLPTNREEILKAIQKELNLSAEIHCISPLEAKNIQFDIGDSATNGSFYLKHPVLNSVYIRPCDYEATLAREKEAAFRRLASSLGAKKIVLKDAKFFEKSGELSSSITLPIMISSNIGININFEQNGTIIKEVYSEYGPPRSKPYIPEELKSWVEIDPDLRLMANDRMEGNLVKHQVTLQFKDTFTGSGRIAFQIAKKGLDSGGSVVKNVSSIWTFEVEYYPIVENI